MGTGSLPSITIRYGDINTWGAVVALPCTTASAVAAAATEAGWCGIGMTDVELRRERDITFATASS